MARKFQSKFTVADPSEYVEDSFRANAKGYLPISSILKLTRYEVNDARWNEARGILQDAMKPVPGKRYLNCRVRDTPQQDFKTIRLDLADCWPVADAASDTQAGKEVE